jgi:hypothetical protein
MKAAALAAGAMLLLGGCAKADRSAQIQEKLQQMLFPADPHGHGVTVTMSGPGEYKADIPDWRRLSSSAITLGHASFILHQDGDDHYRVDHFVIPKTLDITQGAAGTTTHITYETADLSGLWDASLNQFTALSGDLHHVTVRQGANAFATTIGAVHYEQKLTPAGAGRFNGSGQIDLVDLATQEDQGGTRPNARHIRSEVTVMDYNLAGYLAKIGELAALARQNQPLKLLSWGLRLLAENVGAVQSTVTMEGVAALPGGLAIPDLQVTLAVADMEKRSGSVRLHAVLLPRTDKSQLDIALTHVAPRDALSALAMDLDQQDTAAPHLLSRLRSDGAELAVDIRNTSQPNNNFSGKGQMTFLPEAKLFVAGSFDIDIENAQAYTAVLGALPPAQQQLIAQLLSLSEERPGPNGTTMNHFHLELDRGGAFSLNGRPLGAP